MIQLASKYTNYFDASRIPGEITEKAVGITAQYAVRIVTKSAAMLKNNPKGGYRGNRPGWQSGGPKRAKAKDHPVPIADSIESRQISLLKYQIGVYGHQYAQYVEFENFPRAGKLSFLYPTLGDIKPQYLAEMEKIVLEVTKGD